MTKAHDALCLATDNTPISNNIKRLLRLIACDDVIMAFKDGSYLVYKYNDISYRQDKLIIAQSDDLPFEI
ncbi:Uncharacterised protein [Moraxella equi]|nr:Uncharacterised protein [Moraxella equi]STZ02506.1 Uncharacterised protein [Moraxella equi]STZ02518.1 Uncharacterised protein [Moraxella equi]